MRAARFVSGLGRLHLGGALVVLGLGAYFGTGRTSITAMIPAFFGVVLLVLGLISLKEAARKHAMHAAAVLGLFGFTLPLARLTTKIEVAEWVQLGMSMVSGVFLWLCIRSFLEARRLRAKEAEE